MGLVSLAFLCAGCDAAMRVTGRLEGVSAQEAGECTLMLQKKSDGRILDSRVLEAVSFEEGYTVNPRSTDYVFLVHCQGFQDYVSDVQRFPPTFFSRDVEKRTVRLGTITLRRTGGERTVAAILFSLDGSEKAMREAIGALERADVDADIRAASLRSDRRLLGLYGYALEIPALAADADGPPAGYVVVPVKGTSDFIRSPVQARFQELVRAYAVVYNGGILASGAAAK